MDKSNRLLEKQIRQAASFIKKGRKARAYPILREILLKDNKNLVAWELISQATDRKAERVYSLKQILSLDPGHAWARKQLDLLEPPKSAEEAAGQLSQLPGEGKPGLSDEWGLSSPTTQPPLRSSPLVQTPPPTSRSLPKKRRRIPLVLYFSGVMGVLCVGIWAYYLLVLFNNSRMNSNQQLTQTAAALQQASCQVLINQAMQAAGTSCDKLSGNSVCYGNFTLKSQVAPDSSTSFSQRGDTIKIQDLQELSASPLNVSNNQWGIAIFKVMANLPRSLPGETVTLMLFGNTTLDNQSTNLESFYFSSQLGQVTCDQVPFDGIKIDTPEGSGVEFKVNGAELTLMGDATLKANKGGNMDVSLYSGSAKIASNGQEQYFGAGEKVSVGLGGDNGMQAISPPSAPVPLDPAEMQVACTMYGKFCNTAEITPVSVEDAQANIQAELAATPTPTQSMTRTPTISLTSTVSLTPSITPTPTRTGSPTVTPTGSRTPTRTTTSTRSNTPTQTVTAGGTNSPTYTFTSSSIPSSTYTRTPTPSYTATTGATNTPGNTPTDTSSFTPTNTPTDTPTVTPSSTYTTTSTATITSTPSLTFTPTVTPSPVPVAVVTITVPTVDGSHPLHPETDFEAEAWDTAIGTTNGDGINYVNFWFSGPSDLGHPVGSPHTENSVRYCAFGGVGSCNIMPGSIWGSLPAGTYTMYVQAVGVSGPSAVATITFIHP